MTRPRISSGRGFGRGSQCLGELGAKEELHFGDPLDIAAILDRATVQKPAITASSPLNALALPMDAALIDANRAPKPRERHSRGIHETPGVRPAPRLYTKGARRCLKSFRCIRRLSFSVIFCRGTPTRCFCFCSIRLETSGAVAAEIALDCE